MTTYVENSSNFEATELTGKDGKTVVALKWNIDLKAGEAIEISFQVKVSETATGTIKNVAVVNGEETNETHTAIVTSTKTAEVIGKTAKEPAKVGDKIKYTITVKNTGDIAGKANVKDEALAKLIEDGILEVEESSKETAEKLMAGTDVEVDPAAADDLHGRFIGQVNLIVPAAGEHFQIRVALQHADDRKGPAVDRKLFPQGVAAEGFFLQIGPDHTDVFPPLHVHVADEAALGQLLAVDGVAGSGVVHNLADAVEAGTVEFVAAVADHGIDPQIGGYAGENVRVCLHHVIHILRVGQPIRCAAEELGLDHVDAQLIHLLLDHAGQAVAQGQDDDDRPHADDDAQHGEQGPHFAGGQGFDGQPEGLGKIHKDSSSSSWGWTTARGVAGIRPS